jgi:hypothetical protein
MSAHVGFQKMLCPSSFQSYALRAPNIIMRRDISNPLRWSIFQHYEKNKKMRPNAPGSSHSASCALLTLPAHRRIVAPTGEPNQSPGFTACGQTAESFALVRERPFEPAPGNAGEGIFPPFLSFRSNQ